jgi:hypothetical protein
VPKVGVVMAGPRTAAAAAANLQKNIQILQSIDDSKHYADIFVQFGSFSSFLFTIQE